jgi:mono/diheme cytochrome c family protein
MHRFQRDGLPACRQPSLTSVTRMFTAWPAKQVLKPVLASLALLAACCGSRATLAADEPNRAELLRHYESKVRPILLNRCAKCHGPDEQEGKLRLDSPAATLRGGAAGSPVVAGEPERSLLISAVNYKDDALQMPPEGKLPADEIAALVLWIKTGAVVPDEGGSPAPSKSVDDSHIEEGRKFWAFQPAKRHPLPAVSRPQWLNSAIDAFILSQLDAHQLTPNPDADRATWIRRATLDLTGLPPRPEEVREFTADDSPDSRVRALDRLLASPRYGERWARHWLDIARYSDSNGLDENVAHGNAWRYRDYVVQSLNEDKPFDEFLTEQLAGDLLATPENDLATRHERLIATGFLSLGPKVLAEVDERKMEMDIVDEQIDVVGRAILGLTLGCARCHDHKFDPISMSDYYALAGIFKSTRTMEHFKKVARWYENPIPTPEELAQKAAFDQQLTEKKQAIDQRVAEATATAKAALPAGQELPKDVELAFPEATRAELKKLRDELKAFEKTAPTLSTAMGATEGQVTDVAIHVRGSHLSLGQLVPRRFPQVMASASSASLAPTQSGRLQLAQWLVSPDHPLTSRVLANRIWRWHFGQGLVRSADNFGKLGDRPTHPELLDWLAREVIDRRWSVKSTHRLIMSSSMYGMSSAPQSRALEVDPENQWYWRSSVRRLEAEAIRDSLLSVSGSLDLSMGGSLLHVKNRDYLFDHTSKDGTKYDSPRRSVYLPVIRNNLYDVFQLFDYADASVLNGNRDSTTVAPQALFLLNSDLVYRSSVEFAARARESTADDAGRVESMYWSAFGRAPTAAETERAVAFVRQAAESERDSAWAWLSQALLGSNEFIYVR